jgi:hypothetical protein
MSDEWTRAIEAVERYYMRTERDEERIDDMLRAALPHLVKAVAVDAGLHIMETPSGRCPTLSEMLLAAERLANGG